MRVFKTTLFASIVFAALFVSSPVLAAPYKLVEGYNVLDTVNAPEIGTNFAATSGQERDIAVDAARGIIYMARGLTTTADGRPGGVIGISAIVVTNDALPGSNYRDTGLITSPNGWCQSLAYDPGSDKLWVLGGPLGASPIIYSAPGGTLGGAPNGGNPSGVNAALIQAFRVDTNLLDVGLYVSPSVSTNGIPSRGGAPRGLAVRTVNGTNTTVYVGMGNHVQAWSNDGTNSSWRRVWATLRPPATTLVTTRVALTGFNGVNGLTVDDSGNCFFSVYGTGGRIWCVRPEIIESVADPFSLDFNDTAYGGSSEWDVLPVLMTGSASAAVTNTPQGLTFCRFDGQKSLFVSFIPGATSRAVTRLDLADEISFENGPHIQATVVDGFGTGQPSGGQDGILATMRLKQAGVTQPSGVTQNLLYTDVNSVTNPTFIYANAFVIDTNKGQTIPTSAILKIQIPEDTNAPSITAPPIGQTLLEGGTIALSVGAAGQKPLSYQWQYDSADIAGQTTANLNIRPASTNNTGLYSVVISNIHGSLVSTQVEVTVRPLVRSAAMTLLWSNAAGSRPYLTLDNNTQRGLAYSPDGNHVVVVSRAPTNGVYLLDAETGEDVFPLTLGPNVVGGTLAINAVGAAEDGHIYVANLAQSTNQFRIYRWDFAELGALAQIAYSGHPVADNPRWGDTLTVRGSGNDIQILAGSRSSNVVALFTTIDGGQTFSATPILVADAPNGAFGLGIGFGPGNTFWGKGDGGTGLRHVQFDPVAGTGVVLHTFDTNYPGGATSIAVEPTENLLAAVSIENPDNLRLYDIANPDEGLPLLDQDLFPTDHENLFATGAVAFGDGKVFALDSNNGIIALTLGSAPPPGALTIERNGTIVTLTWSGLGFMLQSADSVTGPYEDIPGVQSGYTEDITSFGHRFFRLRN